MRALPRPAMSRKALAQRGISLVTTLLFMVAALMLGVSVLSVNVMQERTIGNTKDRDLALQAAEAALREAEREIALNSSGFEFKDDCTNGLCTSPSQRAVPSSLAVDQVAGFSWNSGREAAEFPGTSARARYVIEKVGNLGTPSGESMKLGVAPASTGTGYRITALAVGGRAETVVVLQSMYTVR